MPPDRRIIGGVATVARSRSGKRERLVESARELVHAQGVERTTLAEIAAAADVPAGNVYYYFKTRDELVGAVIDSRLADVRELLDGFDAKPDPRARLKALARTWATQADRVASNGCPIGSLSSELNKQPGGGASQNAAVLLTTILDWVTAQYRAMGRRDARALAESLVASFQGAALLANTLRDPKILAREARRMELQIDAQ